jgi:ubiquinone/menaquinone biosynthesis C-methylase UbiE
LRQHYQGRLAQQYDRQWATFTARMLAPVVDLALAALHPGMSVLDVGCGTGTLLRQLALRQPGLRLIGADASPAMLALARAKLGGQARFLVMDIDEPLPAELQTGAYIDCILCTNVLHYVRDPVAALGRLGTILNPGGRIIVADFTRHSWWWPSFEAVLHLADAHHRRTLTPTELHEAVRAAGFTSQATNAVYAGGPWHGTIVAATKP